ncbi:5'/3'-nucleotidase SurE [Dactylosporangium sp. AC04546]|uniref:5'/3'-nucleotidase SurE n=1 Tax=Dactylosporangium sp. AC04546 TaxID=2862460 RepID=UPI001EE0DD54|nr:5'/3'-nucleotidase SurE [Dactylosporangium sp. AC04546]WVK87454.1 5'/3'-nucleotidase SurE [Dactylosporangium sp. AC04546]
MTRIVVTNDDGVAAPGIRALARAARELGHDVVVAAPRAEASGMSAALSAVTEAGRIVVAPVELDGLPGVPAFGVAASPAYIAVLAALGAFGPPPGLLLSGINRGANAGHAVLHSGTVGAALTAANHGISALAVSLDVLTPSAGSSATGGAAVAELDLVDDETRHWATAAGLAGRLLPWLERASAGTVLNLNVPDRPAAAGLRTATMAPFGQVQMALAESGDGFIRTVVEAHGSRTVPGSDLAWLAEGYATVTAIRPPAEDPGIELPAH